MIIINDINIITYDNNIMIDVCIGEPIILVYLCMYYY